MKEILVAKLDKEDQKKLKELKKEEDEVGMKIVYLRSAVDVLWQGFRAKYGLPYSKGRHYIKDKAIYRVED